MYVCWVCTKLCDCYAIPFVYIQSNKPLLLGKTVFIFPPTNY